jgi:hypothetical protein
MRVMKYLQLKLSEKNRGDVLKKSRHSAKHFKSRYSIKFLYQPHALSRQQTTECALLTPNK